MTTIVNILRKSVITISLLFVCFTLSTNIIAQKSSSSDHLDKIANYTLANNSDLFYKTSTNHEAFLEEEIPFEEWMLDLNKFLKKVDSSVLSAKEESTASAENSEMELEAELELEDWMIELGRNSGYTESQEEDIEIEEWMINPKMW